MREIIEMTQAQIDDEIERLERGLQVRHHYSPDNPVLLNIKIRLIKLKRERKKRLGERRKASNANDPDRFG